MILRFILWGLAFIIPAVSFGVPIPHIPYLLIPALVSVDGLSAGGMRRFIIWIGASSLYEMVYQLPIGVFALSLIILAAAHIGLSRLFRIEVRVPWGRWNFSHLVRSLSVAFLWMVGMILISTGLYSVLNTAPSFSWTALWIVWISHGAVLGATGITAMIIGALYWERTSRQKTIFTDDAIIQTTNLSD